MGTLHTPNPSDGPENDLGGILIELGAGWSSEELKEFATCLKEFCKEFQDNGLEMKMTVLPKPRISTPKKVLRSPEGLVVVDAKGNLKLRHEKTKLEDDPELKDIL